ncbi:stage II sporulation protein M [Iamia sp. SCSIO 61187]|uniref:stage II sporulation protein M n=1 Tax=Iamia sp. SCSIO 61187 TaxID=2722752 RepID=UPI001C62B21E|nr:stage II sporulation protein M [Iamia sp. SCSIO 61187]QYG92530.1 stage II sporulation protein M [Iamia sp. SCSIO 61187]
MDVDRFIALHEPAWQRTAELARRAGRRHDLAGPEIDELLRRYQEVTLHLSQARTTYRDAALTRRLSTVVAASHAAVHGARVARLATIRRFLVDSFPAAVWTCRRQLLASSILFWGTGIVLALVFWAAPDRIDLVIPDSYQETYAEEDFVSYYSENPSIVFFSAVTTNNIQVSVLAYGLGALAVFPGALVLFENGAALGMIAGLFLQRGEFWSVFMVYVLPHGLLELTAITVAGAAGLRVGWTLFAPGDRSRPVALGEEGRRSVTIVLGTVMAFVVAGLVEGFVTGAPAIPPGLKIAIGVVVWLAFLVWILGRGRQAVAEGWTGALEELRPTWVPLDPLAPVTAPLRPPEVPAALLAEPAARM